MTMRSSSGGKRLCAVAASGRVACALMVGASLVLPSAAGAAEPAYGSGGASLAAPGVAVGGAGAERRLDLSIGRSVVVDLPRDAKEVFVANPAVANAVVRSTRKIFLIGVANGATSVFIMDAEGRQIMALEVNVGRDLNVLRQTLRTAIPSARIEVRPAGDSILLTGTVSGAGDAQQAVDIATAFVGQQGKDGAEAGKGGSSAAAGQGGGGSRTGAVINALTINGRDQVMLKVAVVEMARIAAKQLGINTGGNWNVLTAGEALNPASKLVGFGTGALGTLGALDGSIAGQWGNPEATAGGRLTALERAGVTRILAEPTLVAISGETATFLAGGEIPIAISNCGSGSINSTVCTPTVTYKPYGVSLSFTPIVLSEGRISLRVATEVSEIDRENQDIVTRTPGFRVRKSQTTVELPSGATMVTAGLISSQSNQTINGFPGLINLPILGALFRSRDFQRRDSELMIMVTPYIAKPMEAARVVRPDDGFVDATDPQTILLGRLNKLYGVAGPSPAPVKGYGGRFGFITD